MDRRLIAVIGGGGGTIMKKLIPTVLALVVVAAACSSDPTASEEYEVLQQELVQAEAQLAEAVAAQAAMAQEATAAAIALEEVSAPVAPEELADLIDDWYAANDLADGSVLDLYVPEGYHLYGDRRIEYDDIPSHLSAGAGQIDHTWLTDSILIAEDPDGRYVVARGMHIKSPIWSNRSAVLFEVVTTADNEFRLVQTAWLYDSEWSDSEE